MNEIAYVNIMHAPFIKILKASTDDLYFIDFGDN